MSPNVLRIPRRRAYGVFPLPSEAAGSADKDATSLQSSLSQPLNFHNAAKIEGYEFTKVEEHNGENSTWRIVCRSPMRVSQKIMMNLVSEAEKNESSAEKRLDDTEMKGHKRSQILRLLDDLSRHQSSHPCRLGYLNLVNDSKGRTKVMQAIILADASRLSLGQNIEIINLTERDKSERRHPRVPSTESNDSGYASPPPPLPTLVNIRRKQWYEQPYRPTYMAMPPLMRPPMPTPMPLPMPMAMQPLLHMPIPSSSESTRLPTRTSGKIHNRRSSDSRVATSYSNHPPPPKPKDTHEFLTPKLGTDTPSPTAPRYEYTTGKDTNVPTHRDVRRRKVEPVVPPQRRQREHKKDYSDSDSMTSVAGSNVATDGEGGGRSKVKPAPSKGKVEPTPKGKVVQFHHFTATNAPESDSDSDKDTDASLSIEVFSSTGTETTRGTGTSVGSSSCPSRKESHSKSGPKEDTDCDHEILPKYREHVRRDPKPSSQSLYAQQNVALIPASSCDRRHVIDYQDTSDSKSRARSPKTFYRLPRRQNRARSLDKTHDGERPRFNLLNGDDDDYDFIFNRRREDIHYYH